MEEVEKLGVKGQGRQLKNLTDPRPQRKRGKSMKKPTFRTGIGARTVLRAVGRIWIIGGE